MFAKQHSPIFALRLAVGQVRVVPCIARDTHLLTALAHLTRLFEICAQERILALYPSPRSKEVPVSLKKHAWLLLGSCLIAFTIGCSSRAKFLYSSWPSLVSKPKPKSTTKFALAKPKKSTSTNTLKVNKPAGWSKIKLAGLFDKASDQTGAANKVIKLQSALPENAVPENAVPEDTMQLRDAIQESINSELDSGLSTQPSDAHNEGSQSKDSYSVLDSKPDAGSESEFGNVESLTEGMMQSAEDYDYRPRDANSLPSDFRVISESEMLSIALANAPVIRALGIRVLDNPAGATTVYDSAISGSDPFFGPNAALAEFDRNYNASLTTQNNDRVFNNATLGGQVQELTQDFVNANAGIQQRSLSGATWQLNSTTLYDANNRAGNQFPDYWETQVEAGVRQPLLRGAGKQFNLIAGPNAQPGFNFSNGIVVARMNTRISEADFEIALQRYVRDLYTAYWDLVRQFHVYKSVLASRELAYETWQTIRAKAEAELEGGEANKEAQARAKYYSYRREVQVALGGDSGRGGLYFAERQLRALMGMPPVDGKLLTPADSPVTARYVFDYDHIVSRAMTGRTELRRQSIRLRQQQLRLIAAKNFLLPQLDLIGRYRIRGFGDDLTGGNTQFSSATRDFLSLDHQEWEFGLEWNVAGGRRQARSAVRNAQLQVAREQSVLHEQKGAVRHEVSNAHAEVSSAYYAMESSQHQVEASRQRLKASEALYKAEKLEIEFLLDAQEELLRAEVQLAADQSRYSISLVEINNTSGTLLSDIGIRMSHSVRGSKVNYLPTASPLENQTAQVNQQGVVLPNHDSPVPTPNYEPLQNDSIPETLKPVPNRKIESLKIEPLETAQLPKLKHATNPDQLKALPVAKSKLPPPQRMPSIEALYPVDPPVEPRKAIVHNLRHGGVKTNPFQPPISPNKRSDEELTDEELSISRLFDKVETLEAPVTSSR